MKKTWKRLCTGFLAFATVVTALPTIPVHAESKQYWTESAERVGIIEKVMNDGSIGSTFNTLLMYYFLEMTESEIANLQKITQSGVFRNRHHALETMKKILKEKQ